MKFLPAIYLGYMFITLYFLFLFTLLYMRNRQDLFNYPQTKKKFSVSFLIPVYNEEDTIKHTLQTALSSQYKGKIEAIVIDDGSTDNTLKKIMEVKKALGKKGKLIRLLKKENSGKADAVNLGLSKAKGELIAVVDADSYPKKDALKKAVGYFSDPKVAAVTAAVLVKNNRTMLEKFQGFEYTMIAWTRKLLDYTDCVYVTPGALSIYRKSALKKVGGFDSGNITEDIEITWRLIYRGYKVKMCLPAKCYTTVPPTLKQWWRQRTRWKIGGMQCISKYKQTIFKSAYNMLGLFIMPFFTLSIFLGLFGLGIFVYLITTHLLSFLFYTSYSIQAGSALLTEESLRITPTVLNFFGATLFVLWLFFTTYGIKIIKPKNVRIRPFWPFFSYLLFYLTLSPINLLWAIFKLATKNISW